MHVDPVVEKDGTIWFIVVGSLAAVFAFFLYYVDFTLSTSDREVRLKETLFDIRSAQTTLPSRVTDDRQIVDMAALSTYQSKSTESAGESAVVEEDHHEEHAEVAESSQATEMEAHVEGSLVEEAEETVAEGSQVMEEGSEVAGSLVEDTEAEGIQKMEMPVEEIEEEADDHVVETYEEQ